MKIGTKLDTTLRFHTLFRLLELPPIIALFFIQLLPTTIVIITAAESILRTNYAQYNIMSGGRKNGVVQQYIIFVGRENYKTIFKCNIGECDAKKKTKTLIASKWAENVVFDYQFSTDQIKQNVAAHHRTKRIDAEYRNPSVSSTASKRSLFDVNSTQNEEATQQPSKQRKID